MTWPGHLVSVCLCVHNIMETCLGLSAQWVGWWGCVYGRAVACYLLPHWLQGLPGLDNGVCPQHENKVKTDHTDFHPFQEEIPSWYKFIFDVFKALLHPAKSFILFEASELETCSQQQQTVFLCLLCPHCQYKDKYVMIKETCGPTYSSFVWKRPVFPQTETTNGKWASLFNKN